MVPTVSINVTLPLLLMLLGIDKAESSPGVLQPVNYYRHAPPLTASAMDVPKTTKASAMTA